MKTAIMPYLNGMNFASSLDSKPGSLGRKTGENKKCGNN